MNFKITTKIIVATTIILVILIPFYYLYQYYFLPDITNKRYSILGYVTDVMIDGKGKRVTIYTDDDQTLIYYVDNTKNTKLINVKRGDYLEAIVEDSVVRRRLYNRIEITRNNKVIACGVFNYPEQRYPQFYNLITKMEKESA